MKFKCNLPRNSTRPMRFVFGFGKRNSKIRTVNDIFALWLWIPFCVVLWCLRNSECRECVVYLPIDLNEMVIELKQHTTWIKFRTADICQSFVMLPKQFRSTSTTLMECFCFAFLIRCMSVCVFVCIVTLCSI